MDTVVEAVKKKPSVKKFDPSASVIELEDVWFQEPVRDGKEQLTVTRASKGTPPTGTYTTTSLGFERIALIDHKTILLVKAGVTRLVPWSWCKDATVSK